MSKDHHKKLLHDNVTKTYQKTPPRLEALINMEAKSISTKLKISDRVTRIAKHLLLRHSKTTKTTFIPIQSVI